MPGGWTDQQLPNVTIIFTAPTGRIYNTKPIGSLFFPIVATSTGATPIRTLHVLDVT